MANRAPAVATDLPSSWLEKLPKMQLARVPARWLLIAQAYESIYGFWMDMAFVLAVASHESDYGTNECTYSGNNIFSIKDKQRGGFLVFPALECSFEAFRQRMMENTAYVTVHGILKSNEEITADFIKGFAFIYCQKNQAQDWYECVFARYMRFRAELRELKELQN